MTEHQKKVQQAIDLMMQLDVIDTEIRPHRNRITGIHRERPSSGGKEWGCLQ